jgi:hypothetical protein
MDSQICLEFEGPIVFGAVSYLDMDKKSKSVRIISCINFHLRSTQVIIRLGLLSILMFLLAWRLTDLLEEILKGEIHMSTSVGILTGMAAILLQVVIILSLSLIIWWIMKRAYVPPNIVR